jgi:hypothetical protein
VWSHFPNPLLGVASLRRHPLHPGADADPLQAVVCSTMSLRCPVQVTSANSSTYPHRSSSSTNSSTFPTSLLACHHKPHFAELPHRGWLSLVSISSPEGLNPVTLLTNVLLDPMPHLLSPPFTESSWRHCQVTLSILPYFYLKERAQFGFWANQIQPEGNSIIYLLPLILVKSNPIVQTL